MEFFSSGGVVYGVILGLSGYMFLLPYFVAVAAICELAMLGKKYLYQPLRNTIGWSIWGLGMIIGNAVPIWAAWDSYVEQASASGFRRRSLTCRLTCYPAPGICFLPVQSRLYLLFSAACLATVSCGVISKGGSCSMNREQTKEKSNQKGQYPCTAAHNNMRLRVSYLAECLVSNIIHFPDVHLDGGNGVLESWL